MGRKTWLVVVFFAILLSACASQQNYQQSSHSTSTLSSNEIVHSETHPEAPSSPIMPQQQASSPTPSSTQQAGDPTLNVPGTGIGVAPYGQPPALTAEETQLTQQLFALINSDRAASGLYPFVWNDTLAGGARLHSWNMYHCGFSHTCPDGKPQCERIANEGFEGYTDCGENIAEAGPYPTPWDGVRTIQEGMVNEGPTGWHHIHLFSTTLHKIGVGVFVDPSGTIWFTEDMVS